ncbi:unnamed protein product [Allacma fusca]|uniref:Uncharacterized protein n=1 Tax=Allacma fusca TaxID=39272 RepID=A0A8J2PWN1_9HEXA|nr:unnamed protein product [Allacma fusca]
MRRTVSVSDASSTLQFTQIFGKTKEQSANMKAVILLAIVALATAAPQVEVLRSGSEVNAENFSYDFALSDQTNAKQSGSIVNPQERDPEQKILAVQGEYSYVSKEGIPIKVTYTADGTGYHPTVYVDGVLQTAK